ncbi:ABC transporter permease [Dinghuibacter silviterrae]|uniref:Putative permease n=1 Tax=Dinghuibacter silviterrae TaxID=1539049 RepID=A0A4R8DQN3_9BACT|nr:ABC transporter permease [Dinghuibacter silviterrae]TDW99714.1 putative permease [Dinghuibacter silviterrae]
MNSSVTIILRSLRRQKEFSLLNVLGLGVGIGSALLLFLLIRNELSYDTYHSKRDRIYRVVSTETYRNGTMDYDGDAPIPLVDALRQEFPEVEAATDVFLDGAQFIVPGPGGSEKKFKEAINYAEPSFFQIFDRPWIQGDPKTGLTDLQTMAISKTIARRWFGGEQDVVGRIVYMGDHRAPFRITGVVADPPGNTDLQIHIFVSFATFRRDYPTQFTDPTSWDSFSSNVQCYFLLKKGATIASMNRYLPHFVAEHYTPLFEHSDSRDSSFFQPFKDMHFDTQLGSPGNGGINYNQLLSLGLIGCFLLLVACINFVNLATALSVNRAREVGVRKVLGSNRRQLLARFMGETAFLVVCSALLGCILAELALGPVCHLLQKDIDRIALLSPGALVFLLVTMVILTVLSGFYPGMVLSGFNPVGALKSKISARTFGGLSLRRALVVFQFLVAQLLIIGTIVVLRQMHYFKSRPMGFDKDAVAVIRLSQGDTKNAYFKNQVLGIPGVRSATLCNGTPATDGIWSNGFIFDNHPHPEGFEAIYKFADADYLSTFQVPMLAGRPLFPSDTVHDIVVNETLMRKLGVRSPDKILGKTIQLLTANSPKATIVGVTRDFVTTSMKDRIAPLILTTGNSQYFLLSVRLDPALIGPAMSHIEEVFNRTFPERIFDNNFLDDKIVGFYQAEAQTATLFKVFAGLAILISCLGLYGLVSFMAVQKTKEVGIRKVLGASVKSIVILFSREFTLLVGIAFALAAPLGYIAMHHWLQNYYFRTDIGWDVFALSVVASILIAWATVGYRSVRAALADPVKAIKYE